MGEEGGGNLFFNNAEGMTEMPPVIYQTVSFVFSKPKNVPDRLDVLVHLLRVVKYESQAKNVSKCSKIQDIRRFYHQLTSLRRQEQNLLPRMLHS